MKDENHIPAGSEPVNPMQTDNPDPAAAATAEPAAPEGQQADPAQQPDNPQAGQADDATAKFEKMLEASQQMIGKQSSEIGELRAKLDEMNTPKEPEGPSEDQQLQDIYAKMDSGEIEIADGMRQAMQINSQLTTKQVMDQVAQQQEQNEISKVQTKFLEDNPDYNQVVQSGALEPYMKSDPMADEYVAFVRYKADQDKQALQQEYEEKIKAAKEEGAKMAKGAEGAGKVLGRQGGSAQAPQAPKRPWNNNQEASAAMMETLKGMRSAGQ